MADVWEKDLAQKTSLTTSDFIRVVGSDNVSYKQRMTSVANTVADASGSVRAKGTLATNTDLNTITTPSTYQLSGAYVNMPSGWTTMWGQLVTIKSSGSYLTQIFFRVTGGIYIRNLDNSTWSAWEQQPTRAEVDAINNKFVIQSATSSSVSISANGRATVQIPCAVSGYEAVGVIGIYVADTDVFAVNEFFVNSTSSVTVILSNLYSEARSSTVRVNVLYRAV